MKDIKSYIFKHFETLFLLFFASVTCIILLAIRLKITHSYFLIFLVWNLFLAAIPYFISLYLASKKDIPKLLQLGLAILWLLFLPNAPYIVTDLVHLSHTASIYKLFDALIISVFALSGLLFYAVSLKQMLDRYTTNLKLWKTAVIKWAIPFLCAFGIYLGRFLRWNSWDILQNPLGLFNDIVNPFIHPAAHQLAWAVTLFFGFGLYVLFLMFGKFQKKRL